MTKEERKNQIRSEGVEFYPPQGGDEADDTLTKEVIVEIIERNFDNLVNAADSRESTIDVEELWKHSAVVIG